MRQLLRQKTAPGVTSNDEMRLYMESKRASSLERSCAILGTLYIIKQKMLCPASLDNHLPAVLDLITRRPAENQDMGDTPKRLLITLRGKYEEKKNEVTEFVEREEMPDLSELEPEYRKLVSAERMLKKLAEHPESEDMSYEELEQEVEAILQNFKISDMEVADSNPVILGKLREKVKACQKWARNQKDLVKERMERSPRLLLEQGQALSRYRNTMEVIIRVSTGGEVSDFTRSKALVEMFSCGTSKLIPEERVWSQAQRALIAMLGTAYIKGSDKNAQPNTNIHLDRAIKRLCAGEKLAEEDVTEFDILFGSDIGLIPHRRNKRPLDCVDVESDQETQRHRGDGHFAGQHSANMYGGMFNGGGNYNNGRDQDGGRGARGEFRN